MFVTIFDNVEQVWFNIEYQLKNVPYEDLSNKITFNLNNLRFHRRKKSLKSKIKKIEIVVYKCFKYSSSRTSYMKLRRLLFNEQDNFAIFIIRKHVFVNCQLFLSFLEKTMLKQRLNTILIFWYYELWHKLCNLDPPVTARVM